MWNSCGAVVHLILAIQLTSSLSVLITAITDAHLLVDSCRAVVAMVKEKKRYTWASYKLMLARYQVQWGGALQRHHSFQPLISPTGQFKKGRKP